MRAARRRLFPGWHRHRGVITGTAAALNHSQVLHRFSLARSGARQPVERSERRLANDCSLSRFHLARSRLVGGRPPTFGTLARFLAQALHLQPTALMKESK